jgi:hypothetical protein
VGEGVIMIAASPLREMYISTHYYIYIFMTVITMWANPIFIFGGGDFGTH